MRYGDGDGVVIGDVCVVCDCDVEDWVDFKCWVLWRCVWRRVERGVRERERGGEWICGERDGEFI